MSVSKKLILLYTCLSLFALWAFAPVPHEDTRTSAFARYRRNFTRTFLRVHERSASLPHPFVRNNTDTPVSPSAEQTHDPPAIASARDASVYTNPEEGVKKMTNENVRKVLAYASQSVRGTPDELRDRLIAYILRSRKQHVVVVPDKHYVRPSERCSWSAEANSFRQKADTSSDSALHLLSLLHLVENDWTQKRGYLYALADGSYLGAWRNGGLIPQDTDIDIFLFLKLNQTRFHFLDEIRPSLPPELSLLDISRIRHVGEPTAHYYPPSRGRLQLTSTRNNATMDITVYTPEKLLNRFAPLCQCRFAPLLALCFEHAEKYLTLAYGPYFRSPHDTHTYRFDILNYNGK